MRLVPHWRAVLLRAWSVWCIALIAVIQGLDAALPLIGFALPIPEGWLPWVTLSVAILAALMRLIPQRSISGGRDADQ
ncbi:hypothetical protein [Ancylobacter radicis]|uniref:Uncharacterized protein n=1 Tax=Ancylobacter radicis TaxID=2836179 RepID=A0ABS5R4V9_9HYPH|nr:hypothetical protein [Ancylobacter radicis]MBS9476252.1 hypothetical protein [Ancylobacter radicis]